MWISGTKWWGSVSEVRADEPITPLTLQHDSIKLPPSHKALAWRDDQEAFHQSEKELWAFEETPWACFSLNTFHVSFLNLTKRGENTNFVPQCDAGQSWFCWFILSLTWHPITGASATTPLLRQSASDIFIMISGQEVEDYLMPKYPSRLCLIQLNSVYSSCRRR